MHSCYCRSLNDLSLQLQFLAPNALSFVQESLSEYNGSLGPASTWADSVKRTHGYTWSPPYHFLDAFGEWTHLSFDDLTKQQMTANAMWTLPVTVRRATLFVSCDDQPIVFCLS
jgi:hypothetical protein